MNQSSSSSKENKKKGAQSKKKEKESVISILYRKIPDRIRHVLIIVFVVIIFFLVPPSSSQASSSSSVSHNSSNKDSFRGYTKRLVAAAIICLIAIIYGIYRIFIKFYYDRNHHHHHNGTFLKLLKICKKFNEEWILAIISLIAILICIVQFVRKYERLMSLVGVIVILAVSSLFSKDYKAICWRAVVGGLLLQFMIGFFVLQTNVGYGIFDFFGRQAENLTNFVISGETFVFSGSDGDLIQYAFFFVRVWSAIIYFSALVELLFYCGVMQRITHVIGIVFYATMKLTPTESLGAAVSIYTGQIQALIAIKRNLSNITNSELHTVISCGFATVAASVLGAYVSLGMDRRYLLAASIMAAPAAVATSKIIYPNFNERDHTDIDEVHLNSNSSDDNNINNNNNNNNLNINGGDSVDMVMIVSASNSDSPIANTPRSVDNFNINNELEDGDVIRNLNVTSNVMEMEMIKYNSAFEAVCLGANEGLEVAWSVIGSIIAFLSLIALADGILSLADISALLMIFTQQLSIDRILSVLFFPIALILGIHPNDCGIAALLIGKKLISNEFIAFYEMGSKYKDDLSPHSVAILTFALTGFANLASIGIVISGSVKLMPKERSDDIPSLALTSLLAGFLANLLNAAIAGMLY